MEFDESRICPVSLARQKDSELKLVCTVDDGRGRHNRPVDPSVGHESERGAVSRPAAVLPDRRHLAAAGLLDTGQVVRDGVQTAPLVFIRKPFCPSA